MPLIPVEHDPFAEPKSSGKLIPVDHDPFAQTSGNLVPVDFDPFSAEVPAKQELLPVNFPPSQSEQQEQPAQQPAAKPEDRPGFLNRAITGTVAAVERKPVEAIAKVANFGLNAQEDIERKIAEKYPAWAYPNELSDNSIRASVALQAMEQVDKKYNKDAAGKAMLVARRLPLGETAESIGAWATGTKTYDQELQEAAHVEDIPITPAIISEMLAIANRKSGPEKVRALRLIRGLPEYAQTSNEILAETSGFYKGWLEEVALPEAQTVGEKAADVVGGLGAFAITNKATGSVVPFRPGFARSASAMEATTQLLSDAPTGEGAAVDASFHVARKLGQLVPGSKAIKAAATAVMEVLAGLGTAKAMKADDQTAAIQGLFPLLMRIPGAAKAGIRKIFPKASPKQVNDALAKAAETVTQQEQTQQIATAAREAQKTNAAPEGSKPPLDERTTVIDKPAPQAGEPIARSADTPSAAKQPWEMTLKEWFADDRTQSPLTLAKEGLKRLENLASQAREDAYANKVAPEVVRNANAKVAEAENTIKLMLKDGKYLGKSAFEISNEHGKQTERAVSEGKPVPRAVLKDYKGQKWADDALAQYEPMPEPATSSKTLPAAPEAGSAPEGMVKYKKPKGLLEQIHKDEQGALDVTAFDNAVRPVAQSIGKALVETADTAKYIGKLWRSFVSLPSRAVNYVPAEHPIGRLRDWIASGLAPEYNRPATWIARKRRAGGADNLARMDADKLGLQTTEAMKRAGFDPESRENQIKIEKVLRGEAAMTTLPAAIRPQIETLRGALDFESRNLADTYRSLGMEDAAMNIESNIGRYMKNIPLETIQPGKKLSEFIGKLLGPRLTRSFGKYKRDKWIVKDNGRIKKFESEHEAKTYADSRIEAKKLSLVTKRGQSKEWTLTQSGKAFGKYEWKKTETGYGVEASDLYRTAARGIEIIEPISAEWRLENEIHDPRYLVARSIIDTRHNAEMLRLFDYSAKKWGQDAPKGTPQEVEVWAKENGLAPLPETGRLHNLAGKYVPKEIAADLTDMVRAPGEFERLYKAYMSAWKSSKTLYNPATHSRNIMGNFFFSYVARNSVLNPANWQYYKDAIVELSTKGDDYRYMVSDGTLGNEFFGAELKRLETRLRKGGDGSRLDQTLASLKSLHNKVGDVYALEDQIFKMAAFKKYRAEGMSVGRASAEVNKWFPNYDRVAKITRIMRQLPIGAPFASFLDQSIRIAGRAVAERPFRVAAIAAAPAILSYLSSLWMGMSPDEKTLLDSGRSYWEPIMPMRNEQGSAMTLDLRYIVPMANDIIPDSNADTFMPPWLMSAPITRGLMDQMYNKESYTGRPIVTEGMDDSEKRSARFWQAIKSVAPYPSGAVYGAPRVYNAATGKSKENLGLAILGAGLGINIRSPYMQEAKVRDMVKRAIGEGDTKLARELVDVWNTRYKPDNLKPLDLNRIGKGIVSTIKTQRRKADELEQQGDATEANRLRSKLAKMYPTLQ